MFDPSYFIDFKFDDKDPIKLVGAPAACKMQFQRPNDGTANAAKLNEQNFMNGDNSNYGAMFANKIMVELPVRSDARRPRARHRDHARGARGRDGCSTPPCMR